MPSTRDTLSRRKPRIAVVVATHRYCFPLERCIQSHVKLLQSAGDLIFVDNGSGGEMTRWAKQNFPGITVLTREQNGFFCGGYNTGMQYAIEQMYDYVLIVNADTEVCNDAYLQALVQQAERHADVAFIGPKVYLRKEGSVQNTVLLFPWFGRYLWHWLTSRFRDNNRSAAVQESRKVEFLNGVCVLCRCAALRQFGLLDETMGGYVEDTDWSWRARQSGWGSLYVPVPSIIHHQAADEYETHSVKSFMLRRNHVYWHMKAGHPVQARLFAVFSLWLARLRTLKAAFSGGDVRPHRRYVTRFREAVQGILNRRQPGDWFGPPSGQL